MQVLSHLPDTLAIRFRQAVPSRQRSSFIRDLLEQSLPDPDAALFALAVKAEIDDDKHPQENKQEHEEERKLWQNTMTDGLDPDETFDSAKLALLCQT